jgi:hypothetical protein
MHVIMRTHEPPPLPAKVRTFEIEGQPVRLIETADGKRTWLCDCESFRARAARQPERESNCGHVAVAIAGSIEDGSIRVTF